MSYRRMLLRLLFVSALTSGAAAAMRPSLPSACMLELADYIVVARIAHISDRPVLRDSFGEIHAVELEIKDVIKGHPTDMDGSFQELIIAGRYGLSEEAVLRSNQTYVLFLKNTDAGLHVLNGGQGAIRIDGSKTETRLAISRIPQVKDLRTALDAHEACIGEDR